MNNEYDLTILSDAAIKCLLYISHTYYSRLDNLRFIQDKPISQEIVDKLLTDYVEAYIELRICSNKILDLLELDNTEDLSVNIDFVNSKIFVRNINEVDN